MCRGGAGACLMWLPSASLPHWQLSSLPAALPALPCPQHELAEALPPGTVHPCHRFLRYEETAAGVTAVFDTPDGERRVEAALLIGCDGGQSGVRQQLLGDGPPSFLGEWTTGWETCRPCWEALLVGSDARAALAAWPCLPTVLAALPPPAQAWPSGGPSGPSLPTGLRRTLSCHGACLASRPSPRPRSAAAWTARSAGRPLVRHCRLCRLATEPPRPLPDCCPRTALACCSGARLAASLPCSALARREAA